MADSDQSPVNIQEEDLEIPFHEFELEGSWFDFTLSPVSTPSKENNQVEVTNEEEADIAELDKIKMAGGEAEGKKKKKRQRKWEYVFKCEACGKLLTSSYNLKRHKKIHSGEKGFKCRICNKLYTRKLNLQTHEQVHRGEKPAHLCKNCSRGFRAKSALTRHLKRTHALHSNSTD